LKPHVVAVTFARGGSKGVPRKNLRLLAGRPLLAHAIEAAQAVSSVDRVVVSTDDTEIAEVARRFGAEVPFMRPAELAKDDSPEWLAWRHAVRELQRSGPLDVLLSVPATSPLRAPADLESCLETLLGSDADVVITVTPAQRNPYFNMVSLEDGLARLCVTPPGGRPLYRRQDAPEVFDMTTVGYAVRPRFVLEADSLFEGRVRAVVVPAERALDIDTELELQFAEFLMDRAPRS
jgi:CMP-N-acetylneuraminic acid synthetase